MKSIRLILALWSALFASHAWALTLLPNDVNVSASGEVVSVRVYDEATKAYTSDWWVGYISVSVGSNASDDQSWLSVGRDWDNTIVRIEVSPNYFRKTRTANIEIDGPGAQDVRSVYIRQAAGSAAVLPGVVEIPGEGGVETVEIKGAKAASFSAPAWVKVSSLDLGARLRVEVARNPAAQERQGTVTIQTDVLGAAPLTLALTQAPAPVAEPPAGTGFTYDAGNGWIYHYNTRTWTYHPPHWAWDSAAGWFVR